MYAIRSYYAWRGRGRPRPRNVPADAISSAGRSPYPGSPTPSRTSSPRGSPAVWTRSRCRGGGSPPRNCSTWCPGSAESSTRPSQRRDSGLHSLGEGLPIGFSPGRTTRSGRTLARGGLPLRNACDLGARSLPVPLTGSNPALRGYSSFTPQAASGNPPHCLRVRVQGFSPPQEEGRSEVKRSRADSTHGEPRTEPPSEAAEAAIPPLRGPRRASGGSGTPGRTAFGEESPCPAP